VLIEDYLLMCRPAAALKTAQFGWGGERAPGLLARLGTDVLPFKPTVATTCYGMNDGGYKSLTEDTSKRYYDAQKAIVQELKKAGVRFVVVGSPGCVDADTFQHNADQAAAYNKTLASLRDVAQKIAQEEGVAFANVHDPMMDVMTKAKAKFGKEYHVGGRDGIHPARNGHLVMAYAFLKALGCNGDIGTITVDLAANKADATDGHKVLSLQNGAVEIESTRYPFCFSGDPANPGVPTATAGVLEFFPFNEDLNRFRLVVKGAPEEVQVTWGKESKVFTAAQLGKGINLAAEFLDNPFADAFAKVDQAVRAQQRYETPLVKTYLHAQTKPKDAPEGQSVAEYLASSLKKDEALRDEAAAAVQPVKHTIKIAVVPGGP
jgi:lysophospholipase L1-like esterase